jgi:ABC-2 type transport system permease protein
MSARTLRDPSSAARIGELLLLDLTMKLKRALAFRVNFAVNLAISLFYSLLFSVFQFCVYAGIHGYPGWSAGQMLLFQAVLLLWTGSIDFLFGGVREFIDLEVTYGNLDRLFVWPTHVLVSLLSRGTNVHAASTVLAGSIGTAVMLARLGVPLSWHKLLVFGLFFAAGLVFYVALLIVYSACTLFMVKMERLREVFDRVLFFASFPADLYAGASKTALIVGFPLALWVYLPVQALLGRGERFALLSVLSSAVVFAAALAFWQRQEARHVSAGG